ncbi:nuclear localization sequence-binding protein isoform X2 [Brassica rapa]|uniref:nuclear localization sequence-binding protein isoform X2 n=1 Tax=Brassica campestris TaxID=3711 RepID=UPI00142E6B82|nr:nuclear localization sequence-binding protein isoform X2 [Brassica rapa]
MASSSKKMAAEAKSSGKRKKSEDDLEQANILVKRKLKDNLETKHMILKKHKVAVKKKTILVGRVPTHAGIADIIDFFKDVGQVVRVQRIVKPWLKANTRIAFVKFASSNEAEKAAQKLENLQIFGQIIASYRPSRLKYCKDHIVWNKDYILGKEDETPPSFVENVLFVSNLSPQTKIFHIIDYFSYVGEVVSVRLIVNPEGRHVGYGFVEFDSADAAHNALELMNGEYLLDHMVFLDVAKLPPYRLLHQYNLAEKLWRNEEYLLPVSLPIEGDYLEKPEVTKLFCGKRITFSDDD